MKILQIHRYFHIEGGAERYFFEISRLLTNQGHKVAFFSMKDERNINSRWNSYFVRNISLNDQNVISRLRLIERLFLGTEVKNKLNQLLDEFEPEIVHLHDLNIFITPLILQVLNKRNIPIVQTVHDNQVLAFPGASLFHDGKICEITRKRKYYKAIIHNCVPGSRLFTALYVSAQYLYQLLNLYNYIDYFITPSYFLGKKLVEYGFDKNKIYHLPYFVNSNKKIQINFKNVKQDYILFFGRLVPEKGIQILIEAVKFLSHVKLIIAGTGDKRYIKELKKQSRKIGVVEFTGFQNGYKLNNLIKKCRFTVLPSLWCENLPNSILESFTFGKPVIASDIGGIPEIVKDGYNGFLVQPGNVEDLAEKINKVWHNPSLCKKIGRNAREYVEKNFGPKEHYKKLMDVYKKAMHKA